MPAMLTALRAYFRVAGALAPGLGARTFANLFLTPLPRAKASRWPPELAGGARPFPIPFQGETLEGWTFGERGPRVLLCHGWGGCAGQLARFVPPLLAAGCQVVAFDGPAHGGSRARRTNMVEFSRVLLDLAAERGPFAAAIGHSFGASSLIYALRSGLALERVALMAPFSSSDRNIARVAEALRVPPRVHERGHQRLFALFRENVDGWDLSGVARRLTARALLIHDRGDEEVPHGESAELAAAWPGATLVTTQGLGHRRILKDATVIDQAVAFASAARARAAE